MILDRYVHGTTVATREGVEQPGAPWENAYIESFNSRLRDELPSGELLTTLAEARYMAEQYRVEYNIKRPHSSLDDTTPVEFAANCALSDSASLRLGAHSSDDEFQLT